MAAADPSLGHTLALWLQRLDAEGFHVGVRERLVVHALLARLAARGELPEPQSACLGLLAPLLCTSPDAQRRYAALLAEFVALKPWQRAAQAAAARAPAPAPVPARRAPLSRRARWAGVCVVALFAATAAWEHQWLLSVQQAARPHPPPAPSPAAPAPPGLRVPPPAPVAERPIYVPPRSLPVQPEVPPPGWLQPLRLALMVSGALCALLLAAAAWLWARRALYLFASRSDEALDERVLGDAQGSRVPVPAALLRVASRGLRQRVAGEAVALDLPATLRATVRAAGAFVPRWRALRHTPEYVALIDRRHAQDHHSAYSESLLKALQDQGVTVHAWYFEGSPGLGCWRQTPGERGIPRAVDPCGLGEVAARHAGQRLLVFAEARCLVQPRTGEAQGWARELWAFPQRAWLSPQPMASWGAAERVADAQGFLVLPLQPEALATLANWLASEDLSIAASDDWPPGYPPLLAQEGLGWVVRQSAPPEQTLTDLLFQLRVYLGPERFQWLCACAIFPALSPALTLALGRALHEALHRPAPGGVPAEDPRRLARGMAALSALPWFRHGRMPAWLREALVQRLDPEIEQPLRRAIEQRLEEAQDDAPAVLATLSLRRGWRLWRRRVAPRDVILVDYLSRGVLSRLAQRLPPALRRRLFRHGLPVQGLQWGVALALLPGVLLAAAAVSPLWQALVARAYPPAPALATVGQPLVAHRESVTSVAFSPDGSRIVSGGADGTLRLWDAVAGRFVGGPMAGHEAAVNRVAFSPDGSRIVSGSNDRTLRLWDGMTGEPVGAPLRGHQDWIAAVAFSPDGRRMVSGDADGTLMQWDTDSGQPVGQPLRTRTGPVYNVAFGPDGRHILSSGQDTLLQVWDADSGKGVGTPLSVDAAKWSWFSVSISGDSRRLVATDVGNSLYSWDIASGQSIGEPLAEAGGGVVGGLVPSFDGRWIASSEFSKGVRLWDVDRGKPVGAPIEVVGQAAPWFSAAFSPDASRVVISDDVGELRVYGAAWGRRVELVACSGTLVSEGDTRRLADGLSRVDAGGWGASGATRALDVAVYTPAAWSALHRQPPPVAGEIRTAEGNDEQRQLAQALQNWLGQQPVGTGGRKGSDWRVSAVSPGPAAVVVNVCGQPEAAPVPTSTPALDAAAESTGLGKSGPRTPARKATPKQAPAVAQPRPVATPSAPAVVQAASSPLSTTVTGSGASTSRNDEPGKAVSPQQALEAAMQGTLDAAMQAVQKNLSSQQTLQQEKEQQLPAPGTESGQPPSQRQETPYQPQQQQASPPQQPQVRAPRSDAREPKGK